MLNFTHLSRQRQETYACNAPGACLSSPFNPRQTVVTVGLRRSPPASLSGRAPARQPACLRRSPPASLSGRASPCQAGRSRVRGALPPRAQSGGAAESGEKGDGETFVKSAEAVRAEQAALEAVEAMEQLHQRAQETANAAQRAASTLEAAAHLSKQDSAKAEAAMTACKESGDGTISSEAMKLSESAFASSNSAERALLEAQEAQLAADNAMAEAEAASMAADAAVNRAIEMETKERFT